MNLGRPARARRPFQSHCLAWLAPNCFASSNRPLSSRRLTTVPNVASLLAQQHFRSSSQTNVSEGDTVRVNGFVRTVRKQKRVAFASISDGSCLDAVQVVLSPEHAEGLSTGVGVSVIGRWTAAPKGKEQTHELHAQEVRILGDHDAASYPLQKKYHSPEFLRTIPHLRSRLPLNALLLRLRSHLIAHLTTFFFEHGYVQTHPPIITSSDCEGAGEVFTVAPSTLHQSGKPVDEDRHFRSQKYLTVSSQLHLEAFAQSVGKAWSLSPCFRAERSDTPRHLSEFYMLEAELAFVEDLNEVMDSVESMLRTVANNLQQAPIAAELLRFRSSRPAEGEERGISSEDLQKRWQSLAEGPWPRITFEHAIHVLNEAATCNKVKFEFPAAIGAGLHAEHERYLAEHLGHYGPIFITDYPRDIKPFYMPASAAPLRSEAPSTVACFDLILPEVCEIVGGSLREHRLSYLLESMKRHGLSIPATYGNSEESRTVDESAPPRSDESQESLRWYLDLRKYGSVPHGGFGLGFDRLLGYLSGVPNIRDIVGFPRWYGRCDC